MRTRYRQVLTVFLLTMLTIGCATGGSLTYERETRPDGTITERYEGQQPPKAITPLTFQRGSDGSFGSDSGATKPSDEVGLKRVSILTWAGIGLLLIAAGLMVARFWMPLIPVSASIYAAGIGAALLFLPAIPTWIVAASAVGVIVLVAVGLWHNRKLILNGKAQ